MASSIFPGFEASVLRNGAPVRFTGAQVSFERGKLGSQWGIDFSEPMVVAGTDTWSITLEFAGYTRKLIDAALSELYGGHDDYKTATTKVSSQSIDTSENMDVLNNYATPKMFCFVNPRWLASVDASAHIDGNTGIVTTTGTDTMFRMLGYLPGNSKAERFFDSNGRLPGKDHDVYPDGTYDFQCFAASSHHDIARQLCAMIGVKLYVNTPDMELQDTCTFASGTKWFDAIKKNFLHWQPDINLVYDKDGVPTILIEHVLAQNNGEPGVYQIVEIDNPSVVSVDRKLSRPNDDRLVEHIIILGRKTKDTQANAGERPDYTPVEIPAVELSTTLWVPVGIKPEDNNKHKTMGSYAGDFGSGTDKWTVMPIVRTETHLGFHEYKSAGEYRRIPNEQMVIAYDGNGEVSRVHTKHWYSKDKQKIVKTQETTSFYTNVPGSSRKSMMKLRCKTTLQNYVIKPLSLALTTEFIEDVFVYYENIVTVGGGPTAIKDDPKPLIEALRANPNYVDSNPDTSQRLSEMTTYDKLTYIDRCDEHTLLKTDVANNRLSKNIPQVNSQVLDNPKRQTQSTTSKENVFRREYKDPRSTGIYVNNRGPYFHASKTIQHDDICMDEQAWAIAQSVFWRKNRSLEPTQWEITLQMPVPLPLDYMATKIRIKDLTRVVNGTDVTIPGGDYLLNKLSYNIRAKAGENAVVVDFNEQLVIGN